jgi:hypothetical protein
VVPYAFLTFTTRGIGGLDSSAPPCPADDRGADLSVPPPHDGAAVTRPTTLAARSLASILARKLAI